MSLPGPWSASKPHERMKRLPFLPWLVLAAAALGFAYGLVHLFQLRFEAGDNYPEYSSLRADPLGTKALYESIEPFAEMRRHLRSLAKLPEGRDTTMLYLGVEHQDLRFQPADIKHLESFVRNGGRLVFGLFPAYQQRWQSAFPPPTARRGRPGTPPVSPTNTPPTGAPPAPPTAAPPTTGPQPFEEARVVPVTEVWGFEFGFAALTREPSGTYQAVQAMCQVTNSSLPVELAVHTALYFRKLEPHWRVLYARPTTTNGLPVMIERSWGRGSLILAADAYPFSNEALRHEPTAALLSWFVGRNHRVVFEESHLGVSVEPGVAALARQYRLTGLFLAALVLAGLFVWKSSVSFLPRHAHEIAREESNEVVGRDSASGLSNLLTRHLPPAELMRTCLEQWNEHVSRHQRPSPARLAAMQNLINAENALPPTQRNPIRLYREFHRILSKRKS
jgi:hypothetical protein